VTVVLPAYNEAECIGPLIREILAQAPPDAEVLLVDDNSPDGTADVVRREFGNEPRVRVIVRTQDLGFAKSIRTGIEVARGESVIVMDTDFNHHPKVIPVLIGISPYTDLVSGSRFAPGGNMQSTGRYVLSLLYNLLIRVVLRTQVQDNLCGYFIMSKEKLLELPLEKIFFGFGDYFFRLIHYAQWKNYRIIEIPIVIGLRPAGVQKNRFFRTFLQYTRALLALRCQRK